MQLTNQFTVRAPLDAAWGALNDVERIAPFVPGFSLLEAEGDTYRGTVKVKVGAVTVSYNAEIRVLERDEQAGRVVMEISGRERRGPGSMDATVTSSLDGDGSSTRISLTTDLQVTGRVAQFGAGILHDVSEHLIAQFVTALESHLQSEQASTDRPAGADDAPAAGSNSSASAEQELDPQRGAAAEFSRGLHPTVEADSTPLDLTSLVRSSILRQAAPLGLGALVIAVVAYLIGRRQ